MNPPQAPLSSARRSPSCPSVTSCRSSSSPPRWTWRPARPCAPGVVSASRRDAAAVRRPAVRPRGLPIRGDVLPRQGEGLRGSAARAARGWRAALQCVGPHRGDRVHRRRAARLRPGAHRGCASRGRVQSRAHVHHPQRPFPRPERAHGRRRHLPGHAAAQRARGARPRKARGADRARRRGPRAPKARRSGCRKAPPGPRD